jgi:hypothetical protein
LSYTDIGRVRTVRVWHAIDSMLWRLGSNHQTIIVPLSLLYKQMNIVWRR